MMLKLRMLGIEKVQRERRVLVSEELNFNILSFISRCVHRKIWHTWRRPAFSQAAGARVGPIEWRGTGLTLTAITTKASKRNRRFTAASDRPARKPDHD
jgi:hypothetical protein